MKKTLAAVIFAALLLFSAGATSIKMLPGVEDYSRNGEGVGEIFTQGMEIGEDIIVAESDFGNGSGAAVIYLKSLTGKLKIKGKSNRRFFIKPAGVKKIEVVISDKDLDNALSLKNKTVTVKGYDKDNKFNIVKFK